MLCNFIGVASRFLTGSTFRSKQCFLSKLFSFAFPCIPFLLGIFLRESRFNSKLFSFALLRIPFLLGNFLRKAFATPSLNLAQKNIKRAAQRR